MDWTVFGNIVNILAALVTIGSPVFSVVRAIAQNKQSHNLSVGKSTVSANHAQNIPTTSQINTNMIPWYIWVKTVVKSLLLMFENSISLTILLYLFVGGISLGAVFIFCFLVNIPTAWMSTQGMRVFVLCSILTFSLHFSVTYAEHAQLFLQEELEKREQYTTGKGKTQDADI